MSADEDYAPGREAVSPGDYCTVTRDVSVRGARAFARGERVLIEAVEPNPSNPANRFVVRSAATGKRYQLREEDLLPPGGAAPRRAYHGRRRTRPGEWISGRTLWLFAGGAVAVAAAVLALVLVLGGEGREPYTVWVAGEQGTMLSSVDGGKTFQRHGIATVSVLRGVAARDRDTAVFAGRGAGRGGILYLLTGRGDVIDDRSDECPRDCSLYGAAVTEEVALAVGRGPESPGGLALVSSDGGAGWAETGEVPPLNSVSAEGGLALAAGMGGTVLVSKDGGGSWQARETGTGADLYCVFALEGGAAYAAGLEGTVLKMPAGGSWEPLDSGTEEHLYGVCALAEHAWAVGTQGTVLKSSDGGRSWKKLDSGTTKTLRGVAAVDSRTAFAAGDGGTLVGTYDGGATWKSLASGTDSDLLGIAVGL